MALLARFSIILAVFVNINQGFANSEGDLSLTDLKWQHRLLIARVSNPTSVTEAIKLWPRAQLKERKLRVFLVHEEQIVEVNPDATLTRISLRHGEFDAIKLAEQTIALIGLDGGVKARLPVAEFNPRTVNTIIDSMPMRMAESLFN